MFVLTDVVRTCPLVVVVVVVVAVEEAELERDMLVTADNTSTQLLLQKSRGERGACACVVLRCDSRPLLCLPSRVLLIDSRVRAARPWFAVSHPSVSSAFPPLQRFLTLHPSPAYFTSRFKASVFQFGRLPHRHHDHGRINPDQWRRAQCRQTRAKGCAKGTVDS